VEFGGGRTVIDFQASVKNAIGFLTRLTLQLDLQAMVLRQIRKGESVGVALDCIVSASVGKGRSEVDVQIMTGGGEHEGQGHLLGGAPATARTQKFFFGNGEDAARFQVHVSVMKESGRKLKVSCAQRVRCGLSAV
jgi:hypothetical protein